MPRNNTITTETEWERYRAEELEVAKRILSSLGFDLEHEQPHIRGERYLQQAVTTTSGRKLILLGRRRTDGMRVVGKVTRNAHGAREIAHERVCRKALKDIDFAYGVLHSPREVLFTEQNGATVFVQEFLETTKPFLARPIEEQCVLALRAFKMQENAHATTYRHHRFIERTFGKKDADGYLESFAIFVEEVKKRVPNDTALHHLLEKAQAFLNEHKRTIEQYGDFLTHSDFVPHNFRVVGSTIYLLDHSSIRFGNKHEGWARFINFMELYNPPLAEAFVQYVSDNRAPEELLSLKLMRIYRLGEIIYYYAHTLEYSSGDLLTLNKERVALWSAILEHVLSDTSVPKKLIETYKKKRDTLRSEDEKKRQIGLH